MSTDLATFDYGALATEARIIVQQKTGEIRERMRRVAEEIRAIGERLIAVRECLPGGQFEAWLRAEFAWSRATAYRYISVAEQFADAQSSQIETIAPAALYALAAPSTPEDARQEALARAEAGESISHQTAKTIIIAHQEPPALPDLVTTLAALRTMPRRTVHHVEDKELHRLVEQSYSADEAHIPRGKIRAPVAYADALWIGVGDSGRNGKEAVRLCPVAAWLYPPVSYADKSGSPPESFYVGIGVQYRDQAYVLAPERLYVRRTPEPVLTDDDYITIATSHGPERVLVLARNGLLAMHESPTGFVITHAPTGRRVAVAAHAAQGVLAMTHLAPLAYWGMAGVSRGDAFPGPEMTALMRELKTLRDEHVLLPDNPEASAPEPAESPAAPAPDLDRGALVRRAVAAGLIADDQGDEGLLLHWPEENVDQLLPLPWGDVAAWLDRYAPDPIPAGWALMHNHHGYWCAERTMFHCTNSFETAPEAIAEAIELSTAKGQQAHAQALYPPAAHVRAPATPPAPTSYVIPAPADVVYDDDAFETVAILVDDLNAAMAAGDRAAVVRTWLALGAALTADAFDDEALADALPALAGENATLDQGAAVDTFLEALGAVLLDKEEVTA